MRIPQKSSPIFMQPELSNVSQNAAIQETPHDNSSPSSQHGIRSNDQPALPLPHNAEREEARFSAFAHDTVSPSRSPERVSDTDEAARLSPASPSPRNRIAEYENALNQSAKKSEGPIFEVIKKSRKPDDKNSPITNLPNGKAIRRARHLHCRI